jgi:hypothetical protein
MQTDQLDLGFVARNRQRAPSRSDFLAHFKSRPHFSCATNSHFKDSSACYFNQNTGMTFSFGFVPGLSEAAPPKLEKGERPTCISLTIGIPGPHVLGLEAAAELHHLMRRFHLDFWNTGDPRQARGSSSTAFLNYWSRANRVANRKVKDPSFSPAPKSVIRRAWEWNRGVDALQQRYRKADVFVPPIHFVEREDETVLTSVTWGDALRIALPKVDLLLLGRERIAGRKTLVWCETSFAVARTILNLGRHEPHPLPHVVFDHRRAPKELVRFFLSQKVTGKRSRCLRTNEVYDRPGT